MMYNEGISIGGKHSFEDFGLVIAEREIGTPPKNSIRKTVPFMNGFYDFTRLNGSPSWGARPIKYAFDIIGATVEEMEAERLPVVNWLCNVDDEDIFDDAIPNYHFHGSFDSLDVSEDGEKVTLTFTFVCYPFMIQNAPKSHTVTEDGVLLFENKGQPTKLKVATTGAVTVSKGGVNYGVPIGEHEVLTLENGVNDLSVSFKNELTYPYLNTTRTENGVTFTVNEDHSITVDGTATATTLFYLTGTNFALASGKHYLRGVPDGVDGSMWLQITVHDTSGVEKYYYKNHNGKDTVFPVVDTTDYCVANIRVESGATVDNVTFTPIIVGEAIFLWSEEVL